MTLLYALGILLLAAALCFGLSRALTTRLLGVAAALLCFGGAALLATAPLPAPDAAPLLLLVLGEASFTLQTTLGIGERALAAVLLGGGGAALLALAGAIAGTVRGFGAMLGWALLCLAAALLSLGAPTLSMVQPVAWAVLALAAYCALRASGVAGADEAPPRGLTLGLLGSGLLSVALLAAAPALAVDALPAGPAAAAGLLAVLALAGAPPLLTAREESVAGPAPLGALLFGLAAPVAGLGWLLRAVAALPVLPTSWAVVLGLVGAIGALACGAGALGERGLRPLLAWSGGAQTALVVAAAGLAGPLAALAGPVLLASLMLSAVLAAAAAVSFERTAGSDDYTVLPVPAAPRLAATIWAVSAAASLGLPPLLGGWGRLWLLETVLEQQPWLLAPLLAGAVLLGLALVAPLAGLWAPAGGPASLSALLPALLAFAPLLLLGAAPELAWMSWLRAVPFAPPELPIDPAARVVLVVAGALLALLVAVLVRLPSARALERDPEESPVALAPETLGATLRPLAYLANPVPALRGLWALLERSSEALRLLISLFEQRYYLLGVLAALLTIMLLMAQ